MKLAFALNISVFQFKLESRILKHVTYISVETERRYELSALGVQVQRTVNMYKKLVLGVGHLPMHSRCSTILRLPFSFVRVYIEH